MSAETEKLLQRVKKMLNLANDAAASEGERDNAMRMAHNILAKYNLTLSMVDQLGDSTANDPRLMQQFDLEADRHWAGLAADAVGQLFFCFYFTRTRQQKNSHCYVGKSVNVATATYMAEYAISSIRKESEKAYKAHVSDTKLNALFDLDGDTRPEASKEVWREAFCAAAAATLHKRCKELAAAKMQETTSGIPGTGTSLAVIYTSELEANQLYCRDVLHLHLRSGGSGKFRNVGSARSAGAAYGSSLNLSQQIGNSSATKRLK